MPIKKKFGKDVVLPKRPLSAYLFFTSANLEDVKARENIATHTDAMRRCGALWSGMTDEEKLKYEQQHQQDAKRQEKQLADLNKHGFFTMEDGSKSTDHVPKLKKKKKAEDDDEKPEKIKKGKKEKKE